MSSAITSGAVDLVGLGRSLAIEPDLPNRILSGLMPRFHVKRRSTGFKFLDKVGFMEITWYTRQLQRMGRGDNPNPDESPLLVFLSNVVTMGWKAFQVRRLRT
jgi:hypothetical protein